MTTIDCGGWRHETSLGTISLNATDGDLQVAGITAEEIAQAVTAAGYSFGVVTALDVERTADGKAHVVGLHVIRSERTKDGKVRFVFDADGNVIYDDVMIAPV
jgi:hypothetical protein